MAANDHSIIRTKTADNNIDYNYQAYMEYCLDENNWFKRFKGEWDMSLDMPPPVDDFLQSLVDGIADLGEQLESQSTQRANAVEELRREKSRSSDLVSRLIRAERIIDHLLDTWNSKDW